jgi:hypothetical protein
VGYTDSIVDDIKMMAMNLENDLNLISGVMKSSVFWD